MGAYMFQLELPDWTDEMTGVVPDQREHVSQLFADGRLLTYSVSQLRNFLWCVVHAADEQAAMEVVAAFPLHPYFTDIMCHPLLFHNTLPASLPEISMN